MLSLDPPKYNAILKSRMKVGKVNVPKHMVTYSTFYRFNNKKGFTQTVTQTADMTMPV